MLLDKNNSPNTTSDTEGLDLLMKHVRVTYMPRCLRDAVIVVKPPTHGFRRAFLHHAADGRQRGMLVAQQLGCVAEADALCHRPVDADPPV